MEKGGERFLPWKERGSLRVFAMKAVTFHGVGDVRVETMPDPEILEPTDAIIRVHTAAICGSDLHLYHGTIPGLLPGSIIGHEYVTEYNAKPQKAVSKPHFFITPSRVPLQASKAIRN